LPVTSNRGGTLTPETVLPVSGPRTWAGVMVEKLTLVALVG
jgi:hypothetical protein